MRRSLVVTLVLFVAVAVGLLVSTLATGSRPVLGLDLQGGAYVVLQPQGEASEETLDQTISIIRNRVDALGVAEPDIARQGESIVVQLPGVRDQQRALDIVGQTAELRFRPVLQELPPEGAEAPDATTPTTAGEVTPGDTTATTAAGDTTATTAAGDTTATTVPGDTTATTAPATPPTTAAEIPTTARDEDLADQQVVLPETVDGEVIRRFLLEPTALTGEIVDTAQAQFDQAQGGWVVSVEFTDEGSERWDEVAAGLVGRQLAIVLDGDVVSAPVIQTAQFGGSAQISGAFTEQEAKNLALVLRYGALPVELEPQTTQTVSATLGRDSLEAGLVAGAVGLVLVAAFMLYKYRLMGLVAIASLTLSAALLWSVVAWLGESRGLALTLAGITGIIVSIGVAVDSNVVFNERVKEEVRNGRTLRSALDGGFRSAWGTVVRADTVSLIGALLLYLFSVGSVRGFAFFLGLSTVLDIVATWFFVRPAALLISRTRIGPRTLLGVRPPAPRPTPTPAAAGGAR